MKLATLAFFISILLSCAVQNMRDVSNLNEGAAVLLIKLSTNYNENNNVLLDDMKLSFLKRSKNGFSPVSQFVKIESPGHYKIIILPSGTYGWGRVYMGQIYLKLTPDSTFSLEPSSINYLGDVFMDYEGKAWGLQPHFLKIDHKNDETSAREFLEQHYPELYRNHKFLTAENNMYLDKNP